MPNRLVTRCLTAACLAAAVTALPPSTNAASLTWDGGAASNDLGAAANWTSDTAPNGSTSDVMVWNGTVAGPLSLMYTTAGSLGSQPGVSFSVAAGQTSGLIVDGTLSSGLRLNGSGVGIAAGAGSFTLGDGVATPNPFNLTIANTNVILSNNSENVATLNSDVRFAVTSAGNAALQFTGTGNWNVAAPLGPTNAARIDLLKLGSGTLTLSGGGSLQGGFSINSGTSYSAVLKEGTTIISSGTYNNNSNELVVGGGDAAGVNTALVMTGGTLSNISYFSVGRGNNGTGGATSNATLSNAAAISAANVSLGYNPGGTAGPPRGTVTLNDSSSLTITGNGVLNLAESATSSMAMVLNNASLLSAAGSGVKTIGQSGTGTLTLNSGTVSFGTGDTRVGYANGRGTLTVNGGAFTTTGKVTIGHSTSASSTDVGLVTVAGGTLTSGNDLIAGLGGAGASGAAGTLAISGGVVNVATTVKRWMIVGQYDSVNAAVTISSGSLNLNAGTDLRFFTGGVSTAATGTITQTGGSVTFFSDNATSVGGSGVIDMQQSGAASASSTYNLNGGTLTANQITSTLATATRAFNFNGGTLKAASGAYSSTFLSLGAGNATANVRDGGAIINTNGFDATLVSPLVHSTIGGDAATDGGLVKNGAGVLTLAGNSTYNGPTSVNVGTFTFSSGLASSITVASGATLAASGTTTGSLTLNSGATFTASTAGTYVTANGVSIAPSTNLVISGSVTSGVPYTLFKYGAGGVSGTGNFVSPFRVVLTDDAVNQLIQGTATTLSLTWSGTSGTWNNAGAADWTGGNQFYAGDTVAFASAGSTNTVTVSGTVLPTATTVNATSDYVFTGSGNIGGSTSFVKDGTGAVTLATANSYAGGTTLNAGLLNVNNASALGSGVVTITGGTLGNSSGAAVTLTTNNLQTWTSDVVFAGPDSLNMGNGRVTLGGAGTRTVTVSSGTLTVGGVTGTSVSGTLGLTKTGPGTLTLNPTAISGALGSVVGDLTIADGSLNMGGFDLTTTGLTGSGTLANGSNTTRWFFTVVSSGTKTFDGSLQDGSGTGKLGFNVSGGGTQIVNGNGSWSDTTTVNGATTKLVLNGVNSGTSLTQLQGGPTLQFGNTAAIAAGSRVNLDGAQTATVIYATDGGDNAYAFGGSSNSTYNFVLDRATPGTNVTHPMSSANVGVAGFGGGTLSVNFARGSNVSGTATASFDQFNLGGGSGGSTTVNPDTGTLVTIGTVTKSLNNSSQALVLGGVTTGNTVTGVISNGATLTGANAISVAKTNSSTWTLSGNSTYTGTTAVLGGILNVNGDNSAATGAVTVAGGSLGGTGSLGGAITVGTGGTIIPGASIGTLTGTQSVSFTDGSTYGFEINSASVTADLLRVGTNLNLSGTVTLALTDLSSSTLIPQNTVLSLVNYAGSWNGGLLTFGGTTLADGDQFTFGVNQFLIDYNSTTQGSNVTTPVGANYLNLVAVPEPTITLAALASLGLAGLMLRRRES